MSAPSPAGAEIDGSKVRQLRILNGYSVRRLASTCGISAAYLSQIELGRRGQISPEVFVRICTALDVEDRQTLLRIANKAVA